MPQSWGQENTLRKAQALVSYLSRPEVMAFNLPSRLKQPLHSNTVPRKRMRLDSSQAPSPWGPPCVACLCCCPCISHMVDATTHSVNAPGQPGCSQTPWDTAYRKVERSMCCARDADSPPPPTPGRPLPVAAGSPGAGLPPCPAHTWGWGPRDVLPGVMAHTGALPLPTSSAER